MNNKQTLEKNQTFFTHVTISPPHKKKTLVFPKIGVPPNHPILISFSIISPSILGENPLFFGNIHIMFFSAEAEASPKKSNHKRTAKASPFFCFQLQPGSKEPS